ncbi:MAG: DUF86 domain-containing protein [Chthonomonadales bacterium]|nr:DUF86 domain-containing protein [Chthonomonadales bacterium]
MSERETRAWHFYVEDISRFAEKALEYVRGMDQRAFVSNELVYDAVLRNIELIGEAATHVPDSARVAHPSVPWRQLIAMRNHLIHGYLGLDNDTLWSILEDDLPLLLLQLRELLGEIQGSPDR